MIDDSILNDWDDLFDVVGTWIPSLGPDHRMIYVCRGCRHWQVDCQADDIDAAHGIEELAEAHFSDCPALQRAVALNRWWAAVAKPGESTGTLWIGDLLNRLRPLADWHCQPDSETPTETIATCRFCEWQTDAPAVARFDEQACLYALNEHRHDCKTLDTMAALIL